MVIRPYSPQKVTKDVHYFHVMLLSLHRNCTEGAKPAPDMKQGKLVCIPVLRGKPVSNLSWFEGGYTHVKTYSILDDRYKDSGRGLSTVDIRRLAADNLE